MRLVSLVFAVTAISQYASAAVLRGIVTEAATGNPLARTLIQIEPIAGTAGGVQTARAGDRGTFEFAKLAPGGWIVKATRPGFLPIENGQRRWNSAGFAVFVAENDAPFVALRMQRFGAVTGTVRDENGIGIPGFEIAAYRAPSGAQPPQLAAHGKSDDRGVFRVSGLEPGTYLIRTAAHSEDQLQFIPTFAPSTVETENARPVDVFPDEEAHGVDVRPLHGRLLRLSGAVAGLPDEVTDITVTLAGEMGREVKHGKTFQFPGLAPGDYELYAEAHESPPRSRVWGAYARMTMAKDTDGFVLGMQEVRETLFTFSPDNGQRGKPPGQLYGRRRDLAGTGAAMQIRISNGRAVLAPGGWDLLFVPETGYYVASVSLGAFERGNRRRADGWNPVLIEGFTSVRYVLSGGGAILKGVVKQGGDVVAGAPVFLEPYDAVTRVRVGELRVTHSGLQGEYTFEGVPPGTYRVCATFEYANPDAAALDLAGAQSLQADAHQSVTRDLDLYGSR